MNLFFSSLFQSFLIVLGSLPRSWSSQIAHFLGDLWFAVDRRHRLVTLNNLRMAYGVGKSQWELKQIARQIFRNIMKIPFEVAWSARLKENELLRHIDFKGVENLTAALKKGTGAIVLTAHTGNWELLTAATRLIGPEVNVIYKPIRFKAADDFIYRLRTRFGARLIPKKRSMRRIMNSLKRNECIGILFDQDPGLVHGIYADFFGIPTCTNKMVAFIALKTKAPVIPTFIARQDSKFIVEFGKEIPLAQSSDFEKDLITNTSAYNESIEAFIRRYPDQWFWVHRRWKHSAPIYTGNTYSDFP